MPYNTWDADTAASQAGTVNSNLDGLNIGEGCPAGNMNAADRMIMSAIRQMWNAVSNPASAVYSGLMPKSGGAFTADVTRQGAGAYRYNSSSSALGGKQTWAPTGTPRPVSPQEGDEFVTY